MPLSADDRVAITDLISQHGHLTDAGQFDRMGEIFTDDVVYDVTDLGGGVLAGLTAVCEAALALGDHNPVAHHVTNIVIDESSADLVHALSKGIGLRADGGVGSVTYQDRIERRAQGWRIAHRMVRRRRAPLQP